MLFCRGVETIIRTRQDDKQNISSAIALPLLLGFAFMLLMDQFISPHAHPGHDARPPSQNTPRGARSDATVDFNAELSELERQEIESGEGDAGNRWRTLAPIGNGSDVASARKQGISTTLGLVVHALVDGMALGVSSLTETMPTSLSMVVFLALVVHKGMKACWRVLYIYVEISLSLAPTSLALASSLLATGMPREECKKCIAIFALATPAGALGSFFLLSLLGSDNASWTGIVLLVSVGPSAPSWT